jgi:hypothetical protein
MKERAKEGKDALKEALFHFIALGRVVVVGWAMIIYQITWTEKSKATNISICRNRKRAAADGRRREGSGPKDSKLLVGGGDGRGKGEEGG